MKFEEAKKYLKEGMKVRFVGDYECHDASVTTAVITTLSQARNDGGGDHYFTDNHKLEILTNPDGSKWVGPGSQPIAKFKVGDRITRAARRTGTVVKTEPHP